MRKNTLKYLLIVELGFDEIVGVPDIIDAVKEWLTKQRPPDTVKNADKNALIDKLLEEIEK